MGKVMFSVFVVFILHEALLLFCLFIWKNKLICDVFV